MAVLSRDMVACVKYLFQFHNWLIADQSWNRWRNFAKLQNCPITKLFHLTLIPSSFNCASLGPVLTGKLSDIMARRAATLAGSASITEAFRAVGLQQAMLIVPVLALALGVVLWMGSRSMARDKSRDLISE